MNKVNVILRYIRVPVFIIWGSFVLLYPTSVNRISQEDRQKDVASQESLFKDALTRANFGLLGVELFQTKKNVKNWKLKSKFAELHRADNYAFMKEVNAEFYSHQTGNVVYTQSDYGRSITNKNFVELEGNVVIRSVKGYEFTMNKLDYAGVDHQFRTNEQVKMRGPVVSKPTMLLEGDGLVGDIDEEHFILKRNVTSQRRMKSNQWMKVTSKRGEFFTNENRAIFAGNVKGRLPEMQLDGDRLEMKMNGDEESILVFGKVEVRNKGRIAHADSATIEMSNNKILLEGRASIDSKGNNIRGNRIILYTDNDKIEVQEAEGKIKN